MGRPPATANGCGRQFVLAKLSSRPPVGVGCGIGNWYIAAEILITSIRAPLAHSSAYTGSFVSVATVPRWPLLPESLWVGKLG